MSYSDPGKIDLTSADAARMMVHCFAAFAALLEVKGVANMSEVAEALGSAENDDPAVRWLFDRLAFELQAPEPLLKLVGRGASNDS